MKPGAGEEVMGERWDYCTGQNMSVSISINPDNLPYVHL